MLTISQDVVPGPEPISRHVSRAAPGGEGRDIALAPAVLTRGKLSERVEQVDMPMPRKTPARPNRTGSGVAGEPGLSRVGPRTRTDRRGIDAPDRSGVHDKQEG